MPDYNVRVEVTVRDVVNFGFWAMNEEAAKKQAVEWAKEGELIPQDCDACNATVLEVRVI